MAEQHAPGKAVRSPATRSCAGSRDELEAIQRRLAMLEALPVALQELSRLSRSLESLAYAALGREGPRLRRRA